MPEPLMLFVAKPSNSRRTYEYNARVINGGTKPFTRW